MCDICRYVEIANFMFQCIYNDLQPVDKYYLILQCSVVNLWNKTLQLQIKVGHGESFKLFWFDATYIYKGHIFYYCTKGGNGSCPDNAEKGKPLLKNFKGFILLNANHMYHTLSPF